MEMKGPNENQLQRRTMKKVLLGILLLALTALLPHSLRAEVHMSMGFVVPEPVVFASAPEVIVLPDTNNVYVVPESDFDMFFWNGWWWRPWEGRWYRSRSYNRGWSYYNNVPSFYYDVDPGWRDAYRNRNWSGHRWNYERIPHQRLQRDWKKWHTNQYWQRNRTWGVESYQPRPQRQREENRSHRKEQYQQRPEVQQHQQRIQEHQRQPVVQRQQGQVQKPKRQQTPEPQQQQVQEQQRQSQAQQHQQQKKQQEDGQDWGQKHQGKSQH
jgi:hypothetical protein